MFQRGGCCRRGWICSAGFGAEDASHAPRADGPRWAHAFFAACGWVVRLPWVVAYVIIAVVVGYVTVAVEERAAAHPWHPLTCRLHPHYRAVLVPGVHTP
eukprot:30676-Chlamydomonas_euryale.AAC.1